MKFNFIYTILISASIFGCSDDSNQVIANTPSTMEKPFHKTKLGEQDESLLISQDDLQKIMSLINSRKNLKTKITTISEAIQQIPHSPTNNKDFSDKKGLVTYQLNEIENEINSEIEMCEKILETQSSTVAINQDFYDKMGSRYESKCSMIRRVVKKFNEILVNKGMSPITIPDLVNTESSHSVKDTGSKLGEQDESLLISQDDLQKIMSLINSRKNLKTKITTISEAIQQIPHSPTNNKDFSDKKGLVTFQLNEIENEINSEIEMCEKILETQSSTVAINQGFYDKMGSRYESKCSMIRRVVEKFNEILVNKGMSPIAIPDLVNTESSHSVKDTGSKFDPRSNNPNIDMDIVQQVKNIVQRNFEYEHKKYEYEEYEDEDEDEGEDEYEEEIDYIKMNKDIRKQ